MRSENVGSVELPPRAETAIPVQIATRVAEKPQIAIITARPLRAVAIFGRD